MQASFFYHINANREITSLRGRREKGKEKGNSLEAGKASEGREGGGGGGGRVGSAPATQAKK